MQESARGVLSWLRANAGRYGVDPGFHRHIDIHLHVDEGPADGSSAGVAMAAALLSAMTGRVVRGDLAMTGEVTLSGQVLRVGGIGEKVLAAHRCGLAGVILPWGNRREVDEDLGDELRRAVEVHQVLPVNPAAAVRGQKHVVTKGATPVLTPAETRSLLDGIDAGSLVGLRDRALLSVMVYCQGARRSDRI